MAKKRKLKKILSISLVVSLVISVTSFIALAYSGDISEQIIEKSSKVAIDIESEGIVLLKNENKTLPLNGKKINIFGSASVSPFLGGTGSGAITTINPTLFYDALDSCNIDYNTELRELYEKNNDNKLLDTGNIVVNNGIQLLFLKQTLKEMPSEKISQAVLERAVAYSDTALVVLGRTGKEGQDLTTESLRLSVEEKKLIDMVTDNFQEVIVLFNIGNVMEMGWLDEYPQIKAAAMIWIPGEFGLTAVGQMLTGEVNPSGKLADTIAYSIDDHPSSVNYGDFSYQGRTEKYVDYRESIYVGYRYFETFAAEKVQYPFGFGLSYTNFDYELLESLATSDNIGAKVRVTNTGQSAGKDVLQLYFEPPYVSGGLEKSKIVLGAYGKTKLLEPGESDVLDLRIKQRDLASYDHKDLEAWVVDSGSYNISVAKDIRTKVFSFAYEVDQKAVYKTDEVTGVTIRNLFSDAYDGFSLLSRQDPIATAPVLGIREANTAVKKADSLPAGSKGKAAPMGVDHPDGIISLRDVYEDDSKWEDFLDQLTLDELALLVTAGGYRTAAVERLGIPATVDNDGPAAVKGRYGVLQSDTGTAFPCATVLACTFNDSLAFEMGQSVALEAEDMGTDTWYAPGANIHRNPRGGRNFEYFSEDPLLSGKMAASVVAGAKAGGLITTVKHYALNDQEQNRSGVFTWADEQTMREIYLKPFEIAIKEGKGNGVMTGLNRIGATWCGGSGALNNDLLRSEWGFEGFVVTDYSVNFTGFGYMSPILGVYNGNDTMLTGLWILQKNQQIASIKFAYLRDPVGFGKALRQAAKNICIAKMQSRAFLDPKEFEQETLVDVIIPIDEWDFTTPVFISPFIYLVSNVMNVIVYLLRFIL